MTRGEEHAEFRPQNTLLDGRGRRLQTAKTCVYETGESQTWEYGLIVGNRG